MSGYQNFQGGDYGDSFYFPSSGSSWGVFGYYNSQKDSGAYAGVANGYWVAGNVAMRIAHEFGHLMGGSHEDGQGAVSGPSGWPGHGATTYCTGLLCYFHIGYKHSIMWHTTLDQNLVRNWAFSSNSWSSGYYTFTKSSYNSDVNHDNLF